MPALNMLLYHVGLCAVERFFAPNIWPIGYMEKDDVLIAKRLARLKAAHFHLHHQQEADATALLRLYQDTSITLLQYIVQMPHQRAHKTHYLMSRQPRSHHLVLSQELLQRVLLPLPTILIPLFLWKIRNNIIHFQKKACLSLGES